MLYIYLIWPALTSKRSLTVIQGATVFLKNRMRNGCFADARMQRTAENIGLANGVARDAKKVGNLYVSFQDF